MRMLRAYIYVSFFIYIHDVRDKQGELKLRDCRYARETIDRTIQRCRKFLNSSS